MSNEHCSLHIIWYNALPRCKLCFDSIHAAAPISSPWNLTLSLWKLVIIVMIFYQAFGLISIQIQIQMLVQRLRLHPRIVHPGELLLQTLDLLTELVVVGRGDGQLGQLLPLLALLLVVDEPITKLGCAQYWRFVGEIVAGKNSQFRDNKKCVIAPLMRTHLKSIFGFWWEEQQLYQEAIFVQLLIFQCLSPNNRHHDS